jgi:hypothetical protein
MILFLDKNHSLPYTLFAMTTPIPAGGRQEFRTLINSHSVKIDSRFDAFWKLITQEVTCSTFAKYWMDSISKEGPLVASCLRKGTDIQKFVEDISSILLPETHKGDGAAGDVNNENVSEALEEVLSDSNKREIFLNLMGDVKKNAGIKALLPLAEKCQNVDAGEAARRDLSPLEFLLLRDQKNGKSELKKFALETIRELYSIMDEETKSRIDYRLDHVLESSSEKLLEQQINGKTSFFLLKLLLGKCNLHNEDNELDAADMDVLLNALMLAKEILPGEEVAMLKGALGDDFKNVLNTYHIPSDEETNNGKNINLLSFAVSRYGKEDARVKLLCAIFRQERIGGTEKYASDESITEKHSSCKLRTGAPIIGFLITKKNINKITTVRWNRKDGAAFEGDRSAETNSTPRNPIEFCQLNQLPNLELLTVPLDVSYEELLSFLENRPDSNKKLTVAIRKLAICSTGSPALTGEQIKLLMNRNFPNVTILCPKPESTVTGDYPINWSGGLDYAVNDVKVFGPIVARNELIAKFTERRNAIEGYDGMTFAKRAVALKGDLTTETATLDRSRNIDKYTEFGKALDALAKGERCELKISHEYELALLLTLLPEGGLSVDSDSKKITLKIGDRIYELDKMATDAKTMEVVPAKVKVGSCSLDLNKMNDMAKMYSTLTGTTAEKLKEISFEFGLDVAEATINGLAEEYYHGGEFDCNATFATGNTKNELMLTLMLASRRKGKVVTVFHQEGTTFHVKTNERPMWIGSGSYFASENYEIPTGTPDASAKVEIHRIG